MCEGKANEQFKQLVKIIWKKAKIPEDWKEGVISPIYKKGEKNNEKNYREESHYYVQHIKYTPWHFKGELKKR